MFYGDLFSLTLPSATHMYSFDSFAYVLNERFQINSMKFRAYSFLQKYRSLRNSAFIFGMEKETKDFGFLFGCSVTNRRKRKEGREKAYILFDKTGKQLANIIWDNHVLHT